MKKYYCDMCGDEITGKNKPKGGKTCDGRLGVSLTKNGKTLNLELITGDGTTWNDGDFCKYCIIDAFNNLDDRNKKE